MKKAYSIFLIYALLICSCAQRRNLVYFGDWEKQVSDIKLNEESIKIQPHDVLRINITSLNPESNSLFTANRLNVVDNKFDEPNGYRISKEGMVNLPVIGNLKLNGLTLAQAQDILEEELTKYVKQPIVEIQLLNFKVTVIGEVNRPSSFTIPGDNLNLLEALGMAGDMTVYGKRENVLVIREQNGKRIMKRLDLNQVDVLNSEFFHLKQNDIVYVEPDKSKAIEFSPNTRIMPIVIASISAVAVLISAVLRRY